MTEEFKATVTGILTQEPEVKMSGAGNEYCRCNVAVNTYNHKTGDKKTFFYDVMVNDQYMLQRVRNARKGWRICAMGTPTASGWADKVSGEIKTKISIWANDVYFLQKDVNENDGIPSL